MPSLTIPLVAAAVFTAGGYLINRAGRHAEAIGNCLFMVFVLTTIGTAAAFTGQAMERHHLVPSPGRAAVVQARAAAPSARVWAVDASID